MLSIELIIQGIRCSRSEFSKLFLQAQSIADKQHAIAFEAIALSSYDGPAIYAGLYYSEENGFLKELTLLVITNGLEDGRLAKALAENAHFESPGNANLEAMVDLANGFDFPLQVYKGIIRSMRITAKILINNDAVGTGILIQPNLILTSWHAVASLFILTEGIYYPVEGSGNRISVEFEDFLSVISNTNSYYGKNKIAVNVREHWCLGFCVCHPEELKKRMPSNLEQLEGHWDYVLIHLAKAPGFERDWEKIRNPAPVPNPQEKIILFQHPGGQTMKVDQKFIVTPNPKYPSVVPGFRFVHSANTLPGSSGGPCFNKDFKLFGIHQGVWNEPNGKTLNRGVPLQQIVKHITDNEIDIPDIDPIDFPIWRIQGVTEFIPVVGCDDFKSAVWESVDIGLRKLFIISGQSGHGKTFRLAVLRALLPESSHHIINISAAVISKMTAAELTTYICNVVGQIDPGFAVYDDINSSGTVWIKTELIPAIITALQTSRNDRLVWICFAELNSFTFENQSASDLLFALYEELLTEDWLRIVLDDMQARIPQTLKGITINCRVEAVTEQEILDFFMRYIIDIGINIDDSGIAVSAKTVFEKYQDAIEDKDKSIPGRILSKEINFMVSKVLKKKIKERINV